MTGVQTCALPILVVFDLFSWDKSGVKYNYAYFPVCVKKDSPVKRDFIADKLMSDYNVQIRKYFYPLLSDLNCYRHEHDSMDTPVAKDISNRVMTLPLFVDMTHEQVDYVCSAIEKICAKY